MNLMDPETSDTGRKSPSYVSDSPTGYRCRSYHKACEDHRNPIYFQSPEMQCYQDRSAFHPTNHVHGIRSGRDQRTQESLESFPKGQKQNYRGSFTYGKGFRGENNSVRIADDGVQRGRLSNLGQEDANDDFLNELSNNVNETEAHDFSFDILRKQVNKKANKNFENFSGAERSSATANWRIKQDVFNGESYNVHERKYGSRQRDGWSRNCNGSNSELEIRHAINHCERGFHGKGTDRGRRKPENYSKNGGDKENWERRSENRDLMSDNGNFHLDELKEEKLCSMSTSKEELDSEKLELPVDSNINSSSRPSANRQELVELAESGSRLDRKSHSGQNIKKSNRHTVQNLSKSNDRYGFPQNERNYQDDTNFNHPDERNELSHEEITKNDLSARENNVFVCEKGTKTDENDVEQFSDRRRTEHCKLAANGTQDISGKLVQKMSDARNVSSFVGSGYQDEGGNTSRNSNGNTSQQRRNYDSECKNSSSKHKQNWQDRNADYTPVKCKHLDNRPRSKVDNEEKIAFGVSDEECLKSQKAEELDDKGSPGSQTTETFSLEVKSSVPIKSFDRHPENPNSGQRKDLAPSSKWQDETQRELIVECLSAGNYECLVCCNVIRHETAVWCCANCYHIYHMYCIKKWAQCSAATASSPTVGSGWRCPTCSNPYLQVPNQYTCFCGKMKDPEFSRYVTPHSCNETCSKERSRGCPHLCNLLCHPGPCPPCSAFVMRSCDCGKTKHSVRCAGDATSFKCGEPCRRALNCGSHECRSLCHAGPCEPCGVTIERKCHCEQETRSVTCGSMESSVKMFSCDRICSRKLSCGVHACGDICHPGPCEECPLTPSKVTHCPCGGTPLTEIPNSRPRETCQDSFPTCGKTCGKELRCGNEGTEHHCKQMCHHGPCVASCDGATEVTCRCGSVTKDLPCTEFLKITESSPFTCDRRCKKKMSCGRHRCAQSCCVSAEHQCQLLCGYKLSCGIHRCGERCHRGNCPSCWQVSFEELQCHCGAEVAYPPIPCGAKPPKCHRPCTRQHPCSHQATHPCHSESTCPPCTVLTKKWCLGHHQLRSNVPCYIAEISCGMQCLKELACLIHKCRQACHKGPCLEGQVCSQPCPMIREKCGHPCQAPCHQGSPCPATACKAEITLQCECGRRKEKGQCLLGSDTGSQSDYAKMTAQYVASKLWEGQSIDLSVLTKEAGISKKNRKLQCDSECSIMERNQRLALSFEIKNPDLSNKLGNIPYSQFLKDFAKQNPTFVANIEKALFTLVTATQQAKVNRKSHAFKVMPSLQRRVIYELAEFYGCQMESFDEEPNKNVVATAVKGKCWQPNVTLTLVQRELAPTPILTNCKKEQIRSAAQGAKQSTEELGTAKVQSGNSRRQKESQIDYFDITD